MWQRWESSSGRLVGKVNWTLYVQIPSKLPDGWFCGETLRFALMSSKWFSYFVNRSLLIFVTTSRIYQWLRAHQYLTVNATQRTIITSIKSIYPNFYQLGWWRASCVILSAYCGHPTRLQHPDSYHDNRMSFSKSWSHKQPCYYFWNLHTC